MDITKSNFLSSVYLLSDLADIKGSGIINHIWITVDQKAYRSCILRFYWDDEQQPSVEVPRHCLYRWHILDPIRFENDLKVTMQALGWWPGGKCECNSSSNG